MMMRNYLSMNSLAYHEKQLTYNMTNLLSEIKQEFPDDLNPDFNNPKYKQFLERNAFVPKFMGELNSSLGLDDKYLSVDLWRDLSNGWCPVTSSTDPKLAKQAIETPKGKMIQFRQTATNILPDGSYEVPKKDDIKTRLGTEFMFVFGERLSTRIGLMATQDPSVEKKFQEICYKVFQEKIVPEMLSMARIRKGKDGVDYEAAAEILAVPFFHQENRSEQPFSHFHFNLMNVARGYDGELHSLCTDEIGANASAIDAIFMSNMKEALEKEFGFVFVEVKHSEDLENEFLKDNERKTVSFDLPEEVIPANVLEYRSVREKEMEAELKKIGKKGYEAKELARHASRDDKTDKSPSELRAKWKSDFASLGWTLEQADKDMEAYKAKNHPKRIAPSDEILEDSFLRNHKEVAFTEYQYKAHIHKQLLFCMTSDDAQREATRIFEKSCNLSMSKDQMEYFKPLLENTIEDATLKQSMQLRFGREAKFIHTSTIERDKYISESLMKRKDEISFMFDKNEVSKAILDFESKQKGFNGKPFKFAKGQREAILMIATEPGAVSNVAGRAGAGKSTLVRVAKDFYNSKGFKTFGTSTSSSATMTLAKDTGMKEGEFHNTTQLIKLLDSGKIKFDKKTVLFWDEAGMADTKSFYEIIKHVNVAGAKLVLIGEKEQLQPIGAGGSFKILGEQFTTTKVQDINRQQYEWQREMVEDFASGRSEKALRSLHDSGNIVITKKEEQRLEKIVDDYINAKEVKITGDITITYKTIDGEVKTHSTSHLTFSEPIKVKPGEVAPKEPQFKNKNFSNQEILDMANSKKSYDKYSIKKALEQTLGVEIKSIDSVQDNLVRTESKVDVKDKMMLAATNDDIDMINEKVREKLKLMKFLPEQEVIVKSKDGSEKGFSIGDRVIFTKNQKSDDLSKKKLHNSDQGEVIGFVMNSKTGEPSAMKLSMDNGQQATIDLSKNHNLKHAYATSIHKSQGQTKTSTMYWVSANTNSLHHAYVACSRHRKSLKMYLSEDMVSKMETKMESKEATASMKKVAEWIAKENKVALPPETLQSFTETRNFLNKHYYKLDNDKLNDPNLMDRFISIAEAMRKTNYKKTSNDYEILDKNANITYGAIQINRIEQIKKYKQKAITPPDYMKAKLFQKDTIALELAKEKKNSDYAKEVQKTISESVNKPKQSFGQKI